MSNTTTLKTGKEDNDYLMKELNKSFPDNKTQEPNPKNAREPSQSSEMIAKPNTRETEKAYSLPRSINGGFDGLGAELDQQARQWNNSARLLEQLRPQMEATEIESNRLQASLARVAPEIAENSRRLSSLIDAARSGDLSGDLGSQFTRTLAKLNELEQLAETLTANHLAMQSIWEQYARAVLQAQRLRDGFR